MIYDKDVSVHKDTWSLYGSTLLNSTITDFIIMLHRYIYIRGEQTKKSIVDDKRARQNEMDKQEMPRLKLDKIWKRFLSGDDKSFDLLYSQCVQSLYIYGAQFTSDKEIIKDCIQDTFIKIYEARTQLHHVSNISSYLHISLKNRLLNYFNREKIYLKSVEVPDTYNDEENTFLPTIIYKEEEQLKQNKIEAIMNLLSPRQKKAVIYRYVEGLSLEEISHRLGINYQSTQNTLQRAIKKVK